MNYPGKILLVVLMMFGAVLNSKTCGAQETKNGLTWYDDVNKASEVSQKTKKPIFALFTGSDWCIWCHRLDQNVFDKQAFKDWAKKNVVLLMLDFPRTKTLPDQTVQQNNSLQQFFKVQGFPTVWLFNMDKDAATNKFNISALGSLGYPQAAPGQEVASFIETANGILKKKS